MKVAIAGGGTGGHLFPALAVAEVLTERGDDVLIFISEKDIDTLATRDRGEFKFDRLPGMGMPRLLSPAIFGFLRRLRESIAHCKRAYRRFEPDAVLGMGGFTSTAPIFAGRRRRVPTFVHESNAIPGKANRLNARMTDRVLLGFQECAVHFPRSRFEVTGTPIRKALMHRVPKAEALASFNLQPDKQTLLVMGGSQGAQGVNQAMIKALTLLRDLPLQVIHLTGEQDEQIMQANYRREGITAHVAAFCHRMDAAYSAADFAVARAGAASLSELSLYGLPAILIPYPFAAENHQALNAEIFERHGAAAVLDEGTITAEVLAEKLRWLSDPARLAEMSRNARELTPANAAERVVEVIATAVRARQSAFPQHS
jgi:UDP-N-acetylglucosamine--N-acetylmuramyl-(pentapeptide) pyrophosphoryl-undecaprenol N-acetylglucosamine transferase